MLAQLEAPAEAPAQCAAVAATVPALVVRELGRTAYGSTFDAMRAFTSARDDDTPDEIWLTEHEPVFTLGLAGKSEHVLNPGAIPVVQSDRGGQVTYHGPGQVVAYLLIDLKRRSIKVRELVFAIESAVMDMLATLNVAGHRRAGMPGVYVDDAKIAALGLKVRNGCTYHGVSLNVDPDLASFANINPCGYEGLRVTSLAALGCPTSTSAVGANLAAALSQHLAECSN